MRHVAADQWIADAAGLDIRRHLSAGLRRWVTPWQFPDPNPFPQFILFPRVERARLAAGEARRRIVGAWECLRYGVAEVEW